MDCIFKDKEEEAEQGKMNAESRLERLEESRKKLEEISKAIEYYAWHKENALREIARIEEMAHNSQIGFDEYDALIREHTQGMPLEELDDNYRKIIGNYRLLEEQAKQEIDLLEGMYHEPEKGSRAPYAMFIMFILLASAGLFIGLAQGSPTGFTVRSGDIGGSDYIFFTIGAGIIVSSFFLLSGLHFKSKNI